MSGDKHEFKAEINELMNLIVNSFYSDKEIFLRELVSNASDAVNKAKRELSRTNDGENIADFAIRVAPNKQDGTLTVSDTGIGMSQTELVENLGTIAKSGTKAFVQAMTNESGDQSSALIGQFGVGFYSSYLVASVVDVYTRRMGADGVYKWSSDANGTYTVVALTEEEVASLPSTHVTKNATHGTDIVLHLKEDELAFLEETKIRQVITTHNQFLENRVELHVTRQVQKQEQEQEQDGSVEEVKEKEVVYEEETRWAEITMEKPVWFRDPETISDKEYMDVYRAVSNELHKYRAMKHISGEGTVEFKGILFVPDHPQNDLYDSKKDRSTVKLYSKNVFITDRCKDLLPEWLEFMYGAVDSPDIPLNVSRELLQGNKALRMIGKTIVKKSIELMNEIMSDGDQWKEFYAKFSKSIKFGINSDHANKDKLLPMLRYETSNTQDDNMISLKEYVERMHAKQQDIYYICGESKDSMSHSPHMELLQRYGYEVLYMTDPMDEYITQGGLSFDGKMFVDITKAGVKIPDPDADADADADAYADAEINKVFAPVVDAFKRVLGTRVSSVTLDTKKKYSSSAVVVCTPAFGMSANMERIMRAQALRGNSGAVQNMPRTIVINTEHKAVESVRDALAQNTDVDKKIKAMYDIACISGGYPVDNVHEFTEYVYACL